MALPVLVFIEGVSGVGKSTLVRMLSEELQTEYHVKKYLEFDYTNPIDFYCTAYLSLNQFEKLCGKYKAASALMRTNTICAGDVRLVRYYNGDTPLFAEPLLSELAQCEFCYHPIELVPLEQYTAAYAQVWCNYAASLDETYDFILFDGSLLHHPINDMIRNYSITAEQAIAHITVLLDALGAIQRSIYYLKTDDIGAQLFKAHIDRGEGAPTNDSIGFWQKRYSYDMTVLHGMQENYQIFDISNNGWDLARKQILHDLIH